MKRIAIMSWLALGAGLSGCSEGGAALVDASTADPDASTPLAPELYGADRTHSPITPYVAENLRAIAARGPEQREDVFAKVGDSATVSTSFLHCFDSGYVNPGPGEEAGQIDLDGRAELKPVIAHFRDGNAAGSNPFERASTASRVGATARLVLEDSPSLLEQEYTAIEPRLAVIMLGTNDIALGNIDGYGASLLDIADRSIEAGIIPIFTAIPPRADAAGASVPWYNAVVRAVAQARQVPFIDLHRELALLPDRGLGPDGVLLSVYRNGDVSRPCVFDSAGLVHGYNVRNLLTIQSLGRLLDALLPGTAAPDPSVRTIVGTGSASDPVLVSELPFSHSADTSMAGERNVDRYDGCAAAQDESGPELIYRLDVERPMRIRATVVDRGSTDIDVHLLSGAATGDACIQRAHQVVSAELEPGTYYLSLDTFVTGGNELSGEYLLVITEE